MCVAKSGNAKYLYMWCSQNMKSGNNVRPVKLSRTCQRKCQKVLPSVMSWEANICSVMLVHVDTQVLVLSK